MDAKTKNLIKVAGVHTATGVAGVSSVVTGIITCSSGGSSKSKKVFGGLAIAAGLADIAVTGISAYQKIKGGNTLIDISTKK